MKLIENITDDEIRLNVKRQIKNMINNPATFEAMTELHVNGDLARNLDGNAANLIDKALAAEIEIMAAMQSKFDLLREVKAAMQAAA